MSSANRNEESSELEHGANTLPTCDRHDPITTHIEDETNEPFVWGSPWAEAYRRVKEDSEHSRLLEAFEKYLSKGEQTTSDGKFDIEMREESQKPRVRVLKMVRSNR